MCIRDSSNYPVLEKEVFEMLTKRGGGILLLRALMKAGAVLKELMQPIEDELTILGAKEKNELQKIERELQEIRQQMQEKRSSRAQWRSDLRTNIDVYKRQVLWRSSF